MSIPGFERIRIRPLERIALNDLAQRRGQSEEDMLAELIREAARRELIQERAAGPAAGSAGQS